MPVSPPHAHRVRQTNRHVIVGIAPRSLPVLRARFDALVTRTSDEPTAHVFWRGDFHKHADGRWPWARLRLNSRYVSAAAVAFALANEGRLPEGPLFRLCPEISCIASAHRSTHRARRIPARAPRPPARKLDAAAVRRIRRARARGISGAVLAREFGVSTSAVSRAARG